MSDTPRTEAEVNRQKCWSDDLVTIDAKSEQARESSDGGLIEQCVKYRVKDELFELMKKEANL